MGQCVWLGRGDSLLSWELTSCRVCHSQLTPQALSPFICPPLCSPLCPPSSRPPHCHLLLGPRGHRESPRAGVLVVALSAAQHPCPARGSRRPGPGAPHSLPPTWAGPECCMGGGAVSAPAPPLSGPPSFPGDSSGLQKRSPKLGSAWNKGTKLRDSAGHPGQLVPGAENPPSSPPCGAPWAPPTAPRWHQGGHGVAPPPPCTVSHLYALNVPQ